MLLANAQVRSDEVVPVATVALSSLLCVGGTLLMRSLCFLLMLFHDEMSQSIGTVVSLVSIVSSLPKNHVAHCGLSLEIGKECMVSLSPYLYPKSQFKAVAVSITMEKRCGIGP